jgi:hypothetical protein
VPMLQRSPSSAGMQMAMGAAARAFPPFHLIGPHRVVRGEC